MPSDIVLLALDSEGVLDGDDDETFGDDGTVTDLAATPLGNTLLLQGDDILVGGSFKATAAWW